MPVVARLVMLRVAEPVLVSVTACALLDVPTGCVAKLRLEGLRLSEAAATPVPLRFTLWGLDVALSVIVTVAVELPAAVGEKVTKIRQLAPALTLEPQVVVSPKAPGLEPVNPILLMLRVSFPMLVSATA